MTPTARTTRRIVACGIAAASLVLASTIPAYGAGLVSQATAQGLNANVANILKLALSPTPTAATNDGTGSNAEVDASPIVSLPITEKLLQVGAVKEAAEANQDGSSYACAGTASPSALIQVGTPGMSCTVTDTGTGGVTLDLGQLPGLGTALLAAGGDIKIVIDAVTAHGYDSGSSAPTLTDLGANVAGVTAQLGTGKIEVVQTSNAPNTDLLGEVLGGLFPGSGLGGLSTLGTTISNLLSPLVKLTTNFQTLNGSGEPEADGSGIYSTTGLHLALLGTVGTVDLAKVTVGPNVPTAVSDAFSFQELPLILGGIAILVMLGFAGRFGVRRARGLV
jgi:hypothetical protein